MFNRQNNNTHGIYATVDELIQLNHACKDLTLDRSKVSYALLDGESKTHFRGRGIDFAEVRPYQAGDDIRNIDWRVTARTQKPYTKLYQEERERPVYILLDQRSPMFFGSRIQYKSVLAAKLAASIGWIALHNNDRIGSLVFSDSQQSDARARRGKHAQLHFLNLICEFNQQLQSPIATNQIHSFYDMLTEIRRVAKPGSAVFIISDCSDYTPTCKEPLSILSRHTDVSLIRINDPLEAHLPSRKNISVSDGTNKLNLGHTSTHFFTQYQANFNEFTRTFTRDMHSLGIQSYAVTTKNKVEDIIHELFASKNRKRRGKSTHHMIGSLTESATEVSDA